MTEKEITDKTIKIVSKKFYKPIQSIKLDSDLVHDFNADSLDEMEILWEVKTQFKLSLNIEESDALMEQFTKTPTVRTLVDIVSKKLNTKGISR